MCKVVWVMHVGIGLTFKEKLTVGIALQRQTNEPLQQIPKVETHEQGFYHLFGMNTLMTYQVFTDDCFSSAKKHAKEIDGIKPPQRQEWVANNQHSFYLLKC